MTSLESHERPMNLWQKINRVLGNVVQEVSTRVSGVLSSAGLGAMIGLGIGSALALDPVWPLAAGLGVLGAIGGWDFGRRVNRVINQEAPLYASRPRTTYSS